jgi:uncharacterized protein (DUF2267 family)
MTQPDHVETFDSTYQKTYIWLNELCEIAGFPSRSQAYSGLRAVLHALRDRLTIEEGADLSAQLPMLIRGMYYEGWRPTELPHRERNEQEFLDHVREELRNVDVDAEKACHGVFSLLERKITEGEIEDIRRMLPEPVRALWS